MDGSDQLARSVPAAAAADEGEHVTNTTRDHLRRAYSTDALSADEAAELTELLAPSNVRTDRAGQIRTAELLGKARGTQPERRFHHDPN